MENKTTRQVKRYLLLLSGFLFLVTGMSLFANLQEVGQQYRQLAAVVGRSFYQAIAATREWNTHHGGVYLPVSKALPSNPLLKDRLRDVTTREGLKLTKVNHAEMVRLISGMLREERGVHIRISSLTPLQPANAPDEWEKSSLESFAKGSRESFEVVGKGETATFRFMSPLKVEPSCVSCHPEHRNRPEDIRGGVSVSFSWTPFQRLMDRNNRTIWGIHLLFLVVSFLLVFLLGRKLVASIEALQKSLLHIRRLEGLVPICSSCKKIRNEGTDPFNQASWTSIEKYFGERTAAEFTHGLCPDCAKEMYPGIAPGPKT
jgi:hypothetical protein